MKITKFFATWMLAGILVGVSFSACSDDRLEEASYNSTIVNKTTLSHVEVIDSGYFSNETQLTRAVTDQGLDGKGGKSLIYRYKWVTLRYEARTASGAVKKLSELLVWPYTMTGDKTPKNYIIGCHSTITSDAERPTNFALHPSAGETNMLALFANGMSQKALVVMPDYEGYGSTVDLPHPYCNRELTAEQVVEGATSALEWFEANVMPLANGWKSMAIGYSQGGAVAAGVLRYCQEHNCTKLRMAGAVCGDGPYDPLATLKQYITDDKLYMPVAPALLLKGVIDTNPIMMQHGCTYQDFVTEKFYKTGIFDWIASKTMNTDVIQEHLLKHSYYQGDRGGFTMMCQASNGDILPYTLSNVIDKDGKNRSFNTKNGKGYNYCTVSECLKPDVIAYFRDGTITGDVSEAKLKALEKALAMNRLTDGDYRPSAGYTFFHSTGDEVVPFCNYESVRNSWGTDYIQGHPYDSGTSLHVGTGASFFLSYCGSLVDEIIKGNWKSGEEKYTGRYW